MKTAPKQRELLQSKIYANSPAKFVGGRKVVPMKSSQMRTASTVREDDYDNMFVMEQSFD